MHQRCRLHGGKSETNWLVVVGHTQLVTRHVLLFSSFFEIKGYLLGRLSPVSRFFLTATAATRCYRQVVAVTLFSVLFIQPRSLSLFLVSLILILFQCDLIARVSLSPVSLFLFLSISPIVG